MMFYAGTDSWVYILFGVLWIAFAIYKGTNKAAGAAKTGTEKKVPATAPSGLEAIMGAFLTEEDVSEDVSEIPKEEVTEKPVVEPEKPVIFEEGAPPPTINEKPAEIASITKARKINIKKAIIYSEILRRPYE